MTPSIETSRPPFVEFKRVAIEDRNASINAGHRVAVNINMAHIIQVGSKDVVEKNAEEWLAQINRQAMSGAYPEKWVEYFQTKYERWLTGVEGPVNGTSVAEWPVASPADVENLRAAHVLSVEDLAQISEQGLTHLGFGARALQNKAKKWLEASQNVGIVAARVAALEVENTDLKMRFDSLMETHRRTLERIEKRPDSIPSPDYDLETHP